MRIIICLLLGALLFSCKVQMSEVEKHYGGEIDGELVPGYSYVNHTKKDGVKPKAGEFAYFYYYFMLKDSVLYTNATLDRPEKMKIPAEGEKVDPKMEHMYKAFTQMSLGDSLSMFIHIDSFPNKPKDIGDAKFVTQTFILSDIKTQKQFNDDLLKERAERDAKAAVFRARETEVAEKVKLTSVEYAAGNLNKDIKTTATGLKYIIHEEGDGAMPIKGNVVEVQYLGALLNGTPFDNSFKRGDTYKFQLGMGRVIKGWDEGISLLKVGTKATFFVPSHLAYGKAGAPPTIPEDAELIFYVEFESASAN